MTYGQMLTQIESRLGVTQKHCSVDGRIKDIADFLYVDVSRGRLMSEILRDIMNRLSCTCADKLISSALKAILDTCEREEASGVILTLSNCIGSDVISLEITGNSAQERTPTPENPIAIKNVGTLVTEGEHAGKYAVPIIIKNDADSPTEIISKTIYLDEPLRQGDTLEAVDGKLIRNTTTIAASAVDWTKKEFLGVPYFRTIVISNAKANARILCSMYKQSPAPGIADAPDKSVLMDGNPRILIRDDACNTAEALTSKLANATFEYDLSEPVQIDISGQNIPTFNGTTIIKIDTETQPSNMTCEYYANGGE